MMIKISKEGKCIYCGNWAELTRDHIPPQCLFPEPKSENLITVPCCKGCNRKFSKDDEYFRDRLIMREDIFDQPGLKDLRNKIKRSLERPQSIKYAKELISGVDFVNVFTNSGLYIGRKARYDVDLNRLRSVINRIVKGLYYYEEEKILDKNYDILTFTMEDILRLDLEAQKIWLNIIYSLINSESHFVGDIFMYKKLITNDDPNASIWLCFFYKEVFFISFTLPKDKINN